MMRLSSTTLRDIALPHIETVSADSSLVDCARKLRHAHVGSVVVAEPAGEALRPLGIVTDRDIVLAAVAPGLDPSTLTAGDVMSRPLATVREDDDLLDALAKMRERGVRRLVVVDGDGLLAGILSVQDVLGALAQQIEAVMGVLAAQREREETTRP